MDNVIGDICVTLIEHIQSKACSDAHSLNSSDNMHSTNEALGINPVNNLGEKRRRVL